MPSVTLGGHRIWCEWQGGYVPSRPTAVFLHDGLGAIGAWKSVPERIAQAAGVNALVYDRLGYGRSSERAEFPYQFMEAEVPVLLELLDHFGLQRVHLIGHSDGGSIALLLSARRPGRVISLVTEAAHVFVEPETQAGIRELVALQQAGQTPAWLSRLHGERAERLLTAWSAGWLSEAHAGWNIEGWLGYVTVPTLVVQGSQDEFGTEAQVQAILNRIGGSTSWIVPGSGHTPHNEAQDEFVTRVSGFIRAHSGGSEAGQ